MTPKKNKNLKRENNNRRTFLKRALSSLILFGAQKASAFLVPFAFFKKQPIPTTLWGWGFNGYGQVGDTSLINRSAPVQIGALTDWDSISAGSLHTVGVKSNGTLWAWGDNTTGNLGIGTIIGKSSPVQVGSSTDWMQASAGGIYTAAEHYNTLAIKNDGTLWAWGDNTYGQIGDNTVVAKSSPVQVGALTTWASASAGGDRCYAIKTDGTLWVWGSNTSGSLGIGNTVNKSSPTQVGALTDWSFVEAGHTHVAAIKSDNTLWAWGQNNKGQLGDGTIASKSSPVQISSLAWRKVSAGESFSVATK